MKSLPEITIVIPTLNRPQGVLRAINSINQQTYSGVIKCVVVDSSLNKETENILLANTFSNKNLEVKYINNPSSNRPIDNWIVGINEFKSGLGKFLCDDDWLHPDFLYKCYQKMEESNCDAVISNICVVKESGTIIYDYYEFSEDIISKKSVVDSILGIKKIIPVTPTAGLMKSEILVKSFFESLKHIECTKNLFGFDFFMSYFSTFEAKGTYLINESLSYSYAGADSMTLNVKKAKIAYCYIFAVIKLIEDSGYKINEHQNKILKHKLGTYKLKSRFMKEYRMLYFGSSIIPRIDMKLLLFSQIKKYYIKIIYFFKK